MTLLCTEFYVGEAAGLYTIFRFLLGEKWTISLMNNFVLDCHIKPQKQIKVNETIITNSKTLKGYEDFCNAL